ncbi:hypothetical protein [Porphyromonas sp.]|uniref:hypothetical protein n=1 Tax=Porphyromonas sp. TaxID=1924944 RepID=UPI0026DC70E9|nr:hypothetical protein [Porphyromonas sp.]MDO4771324.1 hypothetical protein [Porphyromonas sp.]
MLRISKFLLKILPIFFLVLTPFFSGCATGEWGEGLHANKGPGVYELRYRLKVSTPSKVTFRMRTIRYPHVVLNGIKEDVSRAVSFDVEREADFRIFTESRETGLEVTMHIEPEYSGRTDILCLVDGFLNKKKIYEHRDKSTLVNATHTLVVGLGDFDR